MRNFYLSYPICQIVSSKLSWSHYERLSLSARDKNKDLHHPEYTKRGSLSNVGAAHIKSS